MAAIDATFVGEFYDKITRTYYKSATMVGQFFLSDVGIGGGPVFPPSGGGGPPDHIWGPTDPRPTPPIANVPGVPGYRPPGDHIWGPTDPRPTPPIVIPPEQVPPEMKPPTVPPPGTATAVPGNWPTTGQVPPEYVVMNYPGVGPLVVVPPPHAEPAA